MENNLFKSGVLLFALGSMSCISLWAQGTVEDYNRAYALREKYNAKHVLYAGVVPHWVDQTSAFWYVRQTEKGKEYVKVDAASKKRTALFDQQKMASALTEKAGREINAYNLPLQNCRLNISLDTLRFQLDGKFWAYSIKNNRLLDEGAIPSRGKERHWMEVDDEKEGSPVTSPDGKWTAFIKNDNVYVREVATGKEKQLSQDGTLSNYYSSYIQWSPDSKSVVSCRIRPVEKRYVYYVESSPADQAQPKLHKQEYAKPGDELRFKVPCIFEVESGRRLIPSTELFSHREMIMDKRGNLWISTDGGGVSCIDRGWRTVEQFTATPLSRHGLPHNNVKSMCYDMDNDMLYIGTHLGGLSRYDIKKKTFYNYSTDYKSPVMPGRIIHHVKKWKNKIVVSSREGVFLLDTRSNRFTHLPDCFGEAMIFDIDKNGTFYTTSGNNIKAISLDTPHKQEIISLHALGEVSHILSVDKKLYICTLGSGMIVYDTSLKTINTYTSYNSNLPSNYCYSSRLTLNGKLILIGDRGITMFDTDKKTFASIKQDYLKAPIIYGCGICISKENIIYVGDTKGITRVEESDFLSPLQHKQPIYFSNINVNNAIIHPSEEGKILKKSLAFTDRIDLASSQNNIIIEFASSDYINRHVQQIFEYKLEGFDKTWISTTVPFARYTNLSPGNYTLCVRMADGDAQDMAVLNICISLPWYNTWYAWVLYIIIFITIVWMIIRYRKEKNDLFLSLEKERFEKQHIEELNHENWCFLPM